MLKFNSLLSRARDETLQHLIGEESLALLQAIDEGQVRPSNLRKIITQLRSPHHILRDTEARRRLFDLLRPDEAAKLASVLGLSVESSVYEVLSKVRIFRNSKKEETLFYFFNLDKPAEKVNEEHSPSRLKKPDYALFPHQRRAARRVQAYLNQESGRVVLHMPTGSGKTRTSMNIIAEHLRERESGLVVWLAYSAELCEQAASEFEDAWGYLGNREVQVHRFWGDRELDFDSLDDGVLIAGLGKVYSLGKRDLAALGSIGTHCTLVIIDEAHQAVAPTYSLVLESLLVHRQKPSLLGLTATPGRTWADIDEDERLSAFFDRNKVILEVEGYQSPIDYLVEHGYLANAQFNSLLVEPGFELTDADLQRLEENLEIDPDLLRRLAEDEERNTVILSRLEELLTRHKKILLFAATVKHAQVLATVLQARGHNAAHITGETPPLERARSISEFKSDSDQPMVLSNYGVLTTGFDAPQTSCALIARPTNSLVLYSQMVGRAIRGPRAGGNKEAEIVTVVDTTLPGFQDVASAFTNWEDVWS
jgi:superfamily II DNA or RNA helicase